MQHRSWASAVSAFLLFGCAASPPAPVAVAPAAAPVLAPAAMSGSAADEASLAAHQKLVREARGAGFTVSSPHSGEYAYCTYGSATGSRVAAKTCLSEAQMQDWLTRHALSKDDVQRALGCGGSGCGAATPK